MKIASVFPTLTLGFVSLVAGGGVLRTPVVAQGTPDYLAEISTADEFRVLSVPSANTRSETKRSTKYLLPVRDGDAGLVPLVFQNVNRFFLHFDFLVEVFSLPISLDEYRALVEQRATREYFAGVVSYVEPAALEPFYAFTIITGSGDPAEVLRQSEVKQVFLRLRQGFRLRPLKYAPDTPEAIRAAESWEPDPELPVHLRGSGAESEYVPYTLATGYGRVGLFSAREFEEANRSGRFGFQDLLILERAPRDIEGVMAGVVTAEPQGELSHLLVRTARRGSPNAFVRSALEVFAPLAGRLVRLEVRAADYVVEPATLEEAEAFWAENRPRLSAVPAVDESYRELDSLTEMDLSGAAGSPESRFGGKASYFARLQRILAGPLEEYKEAGFAIPMRYYLEFMRTNSIPSSGDPARQVTYEEYLAELFSLPEFQASSEFRFQALESFRAYMRDHGVVRPELVTRLALRILSVFGDTSTMVRFRSSSNVEDALEFNGAGLYDSSSACAADALDVGGGGVSHCDPTRREERGIETALKDVWRSLWNFRAHEERAYYGIPSENVAMGILVTRAFLDEAANGVAFTGNPGNARDRRYVVVAQPGEVSVVSPDPGVLPEKSLLEVEGERVANILRVRHSTLARDRWILSDSHLEAIGAVLGRIESALPVDLGNHERQAVLFDVEFKLERDGSLAFKQVRPFLADDRSAPLPTFYLDIPAGTAACGVWTDGRRPREAHQLQSRITFRPGRLELEPGVGPFAADLVESLEFGPERSPAEPVGSGVFQAATSPGEAAGTVRYSFHFEQRFEVAGKMLVLELKDLGFVATGGVDDVAASVLDEEMLTWGLDLSAEIDGDLMQLIRYGSCTHELLPLNRYTIDLEGGDSLRLEERYREVAVGSAPASFVRAEVVLGGLPREVNEYSELVYSALRHNERVTGWIVLDPPLALGADAVHGVEVELEDFHRTPPAYGPAVTLLGENFAPLRQVPVARYCRQEPGASCSSDFRRGDADGSGSVSLTDAVVVLNHLFRGKPVEACPDAADFDDVEGIQITDSILILTYLFRGVNLSRPPGPFECGPDPTPDEFTRCDYPSC